MTKSIEHADPLAFLNGGGVCGALARATDWARTPLGPPDRWPLSLKVVTAILLNSRQPMFLWWGEDLIQIYNDAYLPSFGIGKHPAAMGQGGAECWQEIWPIIWPQIDDVMRRGKPSWHEDALVPIFRNGRIEDVYWTYGYSPVLNDEGSIGGTLVVCTETTRRVLLAKELALEQEASAELNRRLAAETDDLRRLFLDAPGFMCVLRGPEHVFDLTNNSYMRLIGHRDLIGKPVREAIPEAHSQGYLKLLDNVYRTGEPYIGSNAVLSVHEPGTPARDRIIDFVYQPIRNRDGAVTGIFVEGVDVTERAQAEAELRKSEEALRKADRSKDEFLATLAHELRNPLAPLRSALSIMRRSGAQGDARAAGMIRTMERQVDHLVRLVDDLLEVSRITSGKIELRKHPVDLAEVIRNAVEASKPLLDQAGHTLHFSVPERRVPVEGDGVRLEQVFVNLLNNAAKYTDRGGVIQLTMEVDGQHACVEVRDSGIGIDASLLPDIFEMFSQAPNSPERQREGLGIGLSLVRRLVQMHGGTVEASSKGAGCGSKFVVTLPLADAGMEIPADTSSATPPRLQARRVLIVDDNRDAAELLGIQFDLQGADVRVVHDGKAALDLVDSFRPWLAILDIAMPGMDGYEVARAMRVRHSNDVRLVALTGFGYESDRRKSLEAGFDRHLVKPVTDEALLALVTSLEAESSNAQCPSAPALPKAKRC